MLNYGYQVVTKDSPEMKGKEISQVYSQLGLDGYEVHGDLVMLRIPEHKYRKMREYKDALAAAARTGPTDQFLERGQEIESRLSTGGNPVYWRGSTHGEINE